MKIFYSMCSWGLGHATRSLPVIRRLINESNEVIIYTSGRSLALLKSELHDNCEFIASTEYPSPYSDKIGFALRFLKTAPAILNVIKQENIEVIDLVKKRKIDIIISDSRFGSYCKDIPSYLVFHQPRFIAPFRILPAEIITEYLNHFLINKFDKIIIPDYENNSLSGDLSHNLHYFNSDKVKYIGILSDFEQLDIKEDIDYLFSISGPEPTRTLLEKQIMAQLQNLKGNIAVSLGKPGEFKKETLGNAVIYSFLEKQRRDELMNRAKMVVSRSGYTTIMDVAEIGKKAFFIPTPGQTEQLYLAHHLKKTGKFYSHKQKNININQALETAKNYTGFTPPWKTDKSIENLFREIGLAHN
jgi:uncharacterized protein (TIGR00661 family)